MNGSTVAAFERAFAEYVGARYAIALCNGTATLHTALAALGVRDSLVTVPPLTMSATTIAVLHAGGIPVFADVDPDTWLMDPQGEIPEHGNWMGSVPVSLYGLHAPTYLGRTVDDAAETLRPHGCADFTSYSFQASKILALGEGGMLVTNDEALATRAREFSSLGYRMRADQPRIDPATLKHPTYERHHTLGWNYRMADAVAEEGLHGPGPEGYGTLLFGEALDQLKARRRESAALYREAVTGCPWITPQHVPEGWTHDMWSFAFAVEDRELWVPLAEAVEGHGGERPYAAWRLTYQEPAFRHLAEHGTCPVAEDLQPRIVACQTNNIESARRNADALHAAIAEIGGSR